MYIIFSLRNNAWMGATVPYTSDYKLARTFTHDEAIDACRNHVLIGKLTAFPVALADLEAVEE